MIRILIALDGSELAEQALLHGAAIGSSFDSELVLLRVLSTDETGIRSTVDAVDWKIHRRQAEAYLDRQTEELKAVGLNASWRLEEGNVANRLTCFAHHNNIDLIVLGALGRSGVGPFSRGGTVQKVVSATTTSVLVATPIMGIGKLGESIYERILVPVDGSCGSQWALSMATAIAEIHDSELILMQAIETPEYWTAVPNFREKQDLMDKFVRISRMEAEWRMQELRTKIPANLEVTTEIVVTGNVPHAVNEIAETRDISLVVLSAHGDRNPSAWSYGLVPEFLLAHTNRPVLVFQHDNGMAISKFRSVYLPDLPDDFAYAS